MRVLVLTTVLPGGTRTGGEIVTQSIVDALGSAGRDVHVVGYRRPGEPGALGPGERCAGRRPIETSSAGPRSLAWMTRAIAGRTAYSSAKYRSRSYLRAAKAAIGEGPGAVIVDHAQPHFAAPGSDRAHPPVIFVAHNAEGEMYDRIAAEARVGWRRWVYAREARLIRRAEADLAGRARQVWTLSADDAAYLRSLSPGADVRTLEVASRLGPVRPTVPTCDVALIGSWTWHANAAGLAWFSEEVVPRLPAQMRVEVAGAGAGSLAGRHENVSVRGHVPDVQRFLAQARVVAVPSVMGGGDQIKTLDAIASGIPVVATTAAVRGLGDLPASVGVADDGAEFARQLVRLAADTEQERPWPDAVVWSRARRMRLEEAVATWTAEVTERRDEEGQPAPVEAGRSPTRLG